MDCDDLTFARDGAVRLRGAVAGEMLSAIEDATEHLPRDQAGIRLNGAPGIAPLIAGGAIRAVAAEYLGAGARPVRALLFDKTEAANWSLAWHQDRVIVVRERIEVPGYTAWTVKRGLLHVSPPWRVMAQMVTLRIHLDAVDGENAPLLVAPRSHCKGRVAEADIPHVVAECGVAACLADRGDIWVYATPILHASAAKAGPGRRRVLQVDYAAADLDGGLTFAGV